MGILSSCEPKKVFEYFEMLSGVPHGSGNTRQISDLCVKFAEKKGLRYIQDGLNNVVIFKEGSKGYESAEPIIMQGHLDMVCAKTEDCTKDMEKEGLDLRCDGEWVWAEKTSLGGDNAIAVAMILALLDDDALEHPPIEAVFTVDEETGMYGAQALDSTVLSGRKMINLDSEEEGIFTVSCAGGVRANCVIAGKRQAITAEEDCFHVEISGLLGGHSGVDIDKGRGSANQLIGRFLYSVSEKIPLRIVRISGGKLDNVIPQQAEAVVATEKSCGEELMRLAAEYDTMYKNELAASDAGITLSCCRTTDEKDAFTKNDSEKMLFALLTVPYGIQAMSFDIEGLVQTSLNLGVLRSDETQMSFSFAVRSAIQSQKEMLVQRLKATVEHLGGSVVLRGAYPGWEYNRDSRLRDELCAVYKDLSGREAVISATHGGLECGLFIEKIPGLDCVSLGPDLRDVHSVRERLNIASTERLYNIVRELLRRSR